MNYFSKKNIESISGLSPIQEKIYLNSLQHTGKSDIKQSKFRITGTIKKDTFIKAWNHLVTVHPTLRTIFRSTKERNVQVSLKEFPDSLEVHHIKNEEDTNTENKVTQILNTQYKPFNIEAEPLVRASLVLVSEEESILIVTYHSILLDNYSIELILQDLIHAYQELDEGSNPPPLTRSGYREYLKWLTNQDIIKSKWVWKNEFKGDEVPTSIPFQNMTKKSDNVPEINTHSFGLTNEISKELGKLSRTHQASPQVIMQAVWSLLLSIYCGEDEVIFDYHFNGRHNSLDDSENILGRISSDKPVRYHINKDMNLKQLLQKIKDSNQRLGEHSYIPSNELWRDNNLLLNPEHNRTSLNVITLKDVDSKNATIEVADRQCFPDTEYLHINVVVEDVWQIDISYDQHMFDSEDILRINTHIVTLITNMAKEPFAPLSDLHILSTEERTKIMEDFNQTEEHEITDSCYYQVIERNASYYPDRVAAVDQYREITYGELNAQANQLANLMRNNGFGREDLAVIFAQRDISMLITILAIAKSGGAYIPLDPDHPDARLLKVLSQCQPKFIMTSKSLLDRSQQLAKQLMKSPTLYCLDNYSTEEGIQILNKNNLINYSSENLPCKNASNDLAYIFFTSGSTGLPKGAMVEHVGVLNHLYAKIKLLEMNEETVLVQNASHCFDISVWQFLAALMVGGKVVIYDNEIATNPNQLVEHVMKDRVSILEVVPTMLEMLYRVLEEKEPQNFPLRYLLSTGEALSMSLCQRWLEKYPNIPLVNAYGPTECSDDTTHEVLSELPEESLIYAPIGKPITNFKAYILDRWQRPVPIGCFGEICFVGIGVGRGYLEDQERTDEVFVQNPFNDRSNIKMYRTGDLGSFLPDGRILFHGRIDFQHKIRGNRIELGEIEYALLEHDEVRQCVVEISSNERNEDSIVAYVVTNGAWDEKNLKNYLLDHVPLYMIPDYIIQIPKLPVNSNGKIDRKALPNVSSVNNNEEDIQAPITQVEGDLLKIWKVLLERKIIGTNQTFFEVGGNSLKTIQLRSKINKQFNVDIPLKALFDYQTIQKQASYLENLIKDKKRLIEQNGENLDIGSGCLVLIQQGKKKNYPPLFLIHPISGDVLCYQELADALGEEQTIYGLQTIGYETNELPSMDTQEMAERYLKEIKSVQPEGPYYIAGWSFGGLISMLMSKKLEDSNERVEYLGLIDSEYTEDNKINLEVEKKELIHFAKKELQMNEKALEVMSVSEVMKKVLEEIKTLQKYELNHGIAMSLFEPPTISADIFMYRSEDSKRNQSWNPYTSGRVIDVTVPGDHFSMMTNPNVMTLAEQMNNHIRSIKSNYSLRDQYERI